MQKQALSKSRAFEGKVLLDSLERDRSEPSQNLEGPKRTARCCRPSALRTAWGISARCVTG